MAKNVTKKVTRRRDRKNIEKGPNRPNKQYASWGDIILESVF